MSDDEQGLTQFLNSSISSIRKATEGNDVGIIGPIEIEVAVVMKKVGGGKIRLVVVEAGADYQKEHVSKIKLNIGSKNGMYRDMAWRVPFKNP